MFRPRTAEIRVHLITNQVSDSDATRVAKEGKFLMMYIENNCGQSGKITNKQALQMIQ